MPVAVQHAGGGPVYFAWVDPEETEFGPEHIRYDDYIFRLEIDEQEGKLPLLTIDIKNPGSLLKPARKRWCWLAFDDGTDVKPRFFGRVKGVPTSLFGDIVTVVFEARPIDYLARKQALAETLKVAPYWDALFIDPAHLNDPDTILEGYAASWHHDPVTHEVSITDYLVGEDGEVEFLEGDIVYDSLTFELGDPPVRAVKMDASVTWAQAASGTIDLGTKQFLSFSGQGIFDGWPKQGANIGAGWSVASSSVFDRAQVNLAYTKTYTYSWKNANRTHNNGDQMSLNINYTKPIFFGAAEVVDYHSATSFVIGDPETGRAASSGRQESANYVLQWDIVTSLVLRYDADRARTEHLTFTLSADLQPMLTDDGGTDNIETLVLNGGDVGIALGDTTDPDPPIGDVARRSYFPTSRGLESVAYVINVARAHIISKCRVAATGWTTTDFSKALNMTMRMNARAHDPRLPGSTALGKVVGLKLIADGSSGEFSGSIQTKSAAGYGQAIELVDGEPQYAEADVLGPDVQVFEGRIVALPSGDIGYSPPTDGPADDGMTFPLTYGQAVVRDEIINNASSIQKIITGAGRLGDGGRLNEPGRPDVYGSDRTVGTVNKQDSAIQAESDQWYELELKPVSGLSFDTTFDLTTVGPLSIPAQVDLEAA